jgi:hypothetical protein
LSLDPTPFSTDPRSSNLKIRHTGNHFY